VKPLLHAIVAVCCAIASITSQAAETLFWSETAPAPRPFVAGSAYITSGGLPGGAVSPIVSGVDFVKGRNSVEFLAGRVWWTDQ